METLIESDSYSEDRVIKRWCIGSYRKAAPLVAFFPLRLRIGWVGVTRVAN